MILCKESDVESQADGPAPEGMVPVLMHGHTAPIGGGWLKGSLHIPTCTRDRQSGIRFQPIWSGSARRNAGDAMQMGCMEIRTFHTRRDDCRKGCLPGPHGGGKTRRFASHSHFSRRESVRASAHTGPSPPAPYARPIGGSSFPRLPPSPGGLRHGTTAGAFPPLSSAAVRSLQTRPFRGTSLPPPEGREAGRLRVSSFHITPHGSWTYQALVSHDAHGRVVTWKAPCNAHEGQPAACLWTEA